MMTDDQVEVLPRSVRVRSGTGLHGIPSPTAPSFHAHKKRSPRPCAPGQPLVLPVGVETGSQGLDPPRTRAGCTDAHGGWRGSAWHQPVAVRDKRGFKHGAGAGRHRSTHITTCLARAHGGPAPTARPIPCVPFRLTRAHGDRLGSARQRTDRRPSQPRAWKPAPGLVGIAPHISPLASPERMGGRPRPRDQYRVFLSASPVRTATGSGRHGSAPTAARLSRAHGNRRRSAWPRTHCHPLCPCAWGRVVVPPGQKPEPDSRPCSGPRPAAGSARARFWRIAPRGCAP